MLVDLLHYSQRELALQFVALGMIIENRALLNAIPDDSFSAPLRLIVEGLRREKLDHLPEHNLRVLTGVERKAGETGGKAVIRTLARDAEARKADVQDKLLGLFKRMQRPRKYIRRICPKCQYQDIVETERKELEEHGKPE